MNQDGRNAKSKPHSSAKLPSNSSLAASNSSTLANLQFLRLDPDDVRNEGGIIGSGGFGDVRKAKILKPVQGCSAGSLVAVKELRMHDDRNGNDLSAFMDELQIWARLRHQNVLRLLGFMTQGDRALLVSEYAPNGGMRDYLYHDLAEMNQLTRMRQKKQMRLCVDVTRGLHHLHSQNPPIRHGDIKMENILINAKDEAILCDFGLSSTVSDEPSASEWPLGTTRYLSPELLMEDEPPRTLPSDVWAFGCVMYEILAVGRPYAGSETEFKLIHKIASGEKPAIPEINLDGEDIIIDCWNANPEERPTMLGCLTRLCRSVFTLSDDEALWDVRWEDDWYAITPSDKKVLDIRRILKLRAQSTLVQIAFSPDGRYLGVLSPSSLRVVETETGQLILSWEYSSHTLRRLCFKSDNSEIATIDAAGTITALSIVNLNPTAVINYQFPREDPAKSLWITYSPQDHLLVFYIDSQIAYIEDLETGLRTSLEHAPADPNLRAHAIAMSPDGRFLATGRSNRRLAHVWDIRTGRICATVPGFDRSIAFTPDSATLLLGGAEGDPQIKIWKLLEHPMSESPAPRNVPEVPSMGQQFERDQRSLQGHKGAVMCMSPSRDGKWMVSGSADSHVRVWDMQEARTKMVLSFPRSLVSSVDVCSDGVSGLVACANYQGTLNIWRYFPV